MKNLELVIFDMDGLMFDTERAYYDMTIDGFADLGIEIDTDVLLRSIGTSIFEKDKLVVGPTPPDFDLDSYLSQLMQRRVNHFITHGVPKKPGLDELMEEIERRGLKMAVATSTPRHRAQPYLESVGYYDRFDCVITKDEVTHTKPDPELFLKACETCGIKPENTIVLEDSVNGALAAKNANIKCILIPDVVAPDEEIKQIAYKVLDSLTEVADILFD